MQEIIKRLLLDDAFFYSVLILLVGVTSFGLGRHSVQENESNEVGETVEEQGAGVGYAGFASASSSPSSDDVQVVVSKNGSRYYALWCAGVSRIKEENKIYYESPAEARAEGYAPAANCDGLD